MLSIVSQLFDYFVFRNLRVQIDRCAEETERFEAHLDGYDIIQTVAHQGYAWVKRDSEKCSTCYSSIDCFDTHTVCD